MGKKQKSKTRASVLGLSAYILIALFISVIVIITYKVRPSVVELFDLKINDIMLRQRGVKAAPSSVAIVAVDEKSVNELGRWPWPRKHLAELVEGLDEAGVVAFDMVFSESEDPHNDAALEDAIAEHGNVVMGYFFRNDSTEVPNVKSLEQLNRSKVGVMRYLDDYAESEGIAPPLFKGVEPNISSIGGGAAGFGSFNILNDLDGYYRNANLIYEYDDQYYPVLSVEALRRFTGEDIIISSAIYGIDTLDIGRYSIPVSEDGTFNINYYGPGSTFKTYSAVDVIKKRIPEGTFKDKVIFIGVTEKAVYDIRVTPVDPLYPGVEVHATIAGNILEGWYLRRDVSTLLLTLILIVLFPVILAYIISKLRRTYLSLAVFGGTFLFITLFFYYLYAQYDMLPSLLFPLLSLSLTYIVCEAYRNIIFEQKSKFYKKAFSTYVPPQVVSEILKDPDSLKLGGEKRYVSILFSDIRGFTSLSEKMPPEQLVALLNKYLTPMTEIIFKEKGTLDKYIGDAIMAIFNAPVDLPEHPKKACKVALAMIAKLSKVNMEWTSRGLPSIKIGIGLHCGEAVVGNMGAALRFDYTAIGDTVNTASRLEGMTKLYGVGILVSDDIYKNARDTFIFRELDLLRVKGKNRPIAVYELMEQGERASYLMNQFPKALIDYRKGKFKTAKTAFQSILSEFPDDSPSKLYIKRCEEYIAAPPSQGWDGVYTATTK